MSTTETPQEAVTEAGALEVIGARIREAREAAELTQEDLERILGVTQTAVSYWEAGKREPGVADLLRIADAIGAPASSLLPDGHQGASGADFADGQFMMIAFMGHTELTGYVTEITLGGEPGYHVDLPGRLWGGNPLAWEEYSGKALFSRRPVTEASVRAAWEAQLRRAAERVRQEAEWAQAQEQRALTAGSDGDEDVYERGAWSG